MANSTLIITRLRCVTISLFAAIGLLLMLAPAGAQAPEQGAESPPSLLEIQQRLAARGFNPGPIDGRMGRQTESSLAAFQAAYGLPVSGRPDARTLETLFALEDAASRRSSRARTDDMPVSGSPVRTDDTVASGSSFVRTDDAVARRVSIAQSDEIIAARVPPAVPVPPVEVVPLDPLQGPLQGPLLGPLQGPIEAIAASHGETVILSNRPQPAAVVTTIAAQPASPTTVQTAVEPGDDGTAPAVILSLAELGEPGAQYLLGSMYEYGLGVRQDPAAAMEWFLKAGVQGHAEAQVALGVKFELGRGVRQDLAQAQEWYAAAAKLLSPGDRSAVVAAHHDRVTAKLAVD